MTISTSKAYPRSGQDNRGPCPAYCSAFEKLGRMTSIMHDEGVSEVEQNLLLDVVLHERVTVHFLKWPGGLFYLSLPKADTSFQLPFLESVSGGYTFVLPSEKN